ncbi:MAG: hypothetical protein ACTS6G_02315 [Candidatus Hodgkinia cicadicola]
MKLKGIAKPSKWGSSTSWVIRIVNEIKLLTRRTESIGNENHKLRRL